MMEVPTSPVGAAGTNNAIGIMQPEAHPAPPPVLYPLPPPKPTEADNCHCLFGLSGNKNESNNGMDGVGAGEMRNSAATFVFVERIMHFLQGENILEANQAGVNFTGLIECGRYIVDMGPMDSRDTHPLMKTQHLEQIEEFPGTSYRPFVYKKMTVRLYETHLDIDGKRLWTKFENVCAEC